MSSAVSGGAALIANDASEATLMREAVGIFDDYEALQAAVGDLLLSGFHPRRLCELMD